jgi:formylglycine-generating enzyme required for sulfatase activity
VRKHRVEGYWAVSLRGLLFSFLFLAGLHGQSPEKEKPFNPTGPNTNGLGMRFVPAPGTKVQFSVYQTRVHDFRAFVRESGYTHMRETSEPDSRMWSLDRDGEKQRGQSWEDPGFKQTEDHPVVGVNWYDAKAFCEWLTLRERAAARLPADWEYRLPTDHEWSVEVGLVEEDPAKTPEEKDGKIKGQYPWGEWAEGKPPPAGAGNYAGAEADDGHWPAMFKTIPGYYDGYARTAPVGSFKPNRHGIYDLGSNVAEWCEDAYKPGGRHRVLRGASWYVFDRNALLSSARYHVQPGFRDDRNGFRCVAGPLTP